MTDREWIDKAAENWKTKPPFYPPSWFEQVVTWIVAGAVGDVFLSAPSVNLCRY